MSDTRYLAHVTKKKKPPRMALINVAVVIEREVKALRDASLAAEWLAAPWPSRSAKRHTAKARRIAEVAAWLREQAGP